MSGFTGKELVSQGHELTELVNRAKLLNAYLAKINPLIPSTEPVQFTVREFANLIGLPYKSINLKTLEKQLGALSRISMKCSTEKMPVFFTPAFQYVALVKADEKQTVVIQCSQTGSALFFNLANSGYIKYTLQNISRMKRESTYNLYTYLVRNNYKRVIKISIDDLRKILDCEDKYPEQRRFLDKIFTAAIEEINEKTDLNCSVTKTKDPNDARSVIGVEITVSKKSNALNEADDKGPFIDLNDAGEKLVRETAPDAFESSSENSTFDEDSDGEESWQELYRSVFDKCKFNLTPEERDLVIAKAQSSTAYTTTDLYDYLREIVLKANLKKNLPYPMRYMIKIIESEEEERKSNR